MGGVIEFKFYPLEYFEWFREDTQTMVGAYHPGQSYNCTRKPVHDALRAQCKIWAEQGKIRIVPLGVDQQFIMNEVK